MTTTDLYPVDLFETADGTLVRLDYRGALPAEAGWFPESPCIGYPHLYDLTVVANGEVWATLPVSSEGGVSAYDMAVHLATNWYPELMPVHGAHVWEPSLEEKWAEEARLEMLERGGLR